MPCGACTQVPSADFVYIGASPYALPLPCNIALLGTTLFGQWMTLAPGGCPLAPFLSLSGAERIVIGV
jgi:hypothetical protein